NQSPYPMIHLLRKSSVEKVIQAIDTSQIVERNISYLRRIDE
ncbi:MAG: DUF1415 family protein, partial [Bacteroidota bacterium]